MQAELPLFPLSLYLYDENGRYSEPIKIMSDAQLNGPGIKLLIKDHVDRGLEVRITDPLDNMVFHAADGYVLFPTEDDIAEAGAREC